MCGLKSWVRVALVIALIIQSGHFISTGSRNGTAEILWKLTHLALESKQNPTQFQLHPEKYSRYTGPIRAPLDGRQYGLIPGYRPQTPAFPRPVPALPPGYYQNRPPYSVMEALNSIAQNDELRCVPKLLCELTSGPSSGKKESILPFNINLESFLGLFSALTHQSSLLEFGKAAILGYTSKGNTESCHYAYPRCPQDSDRLVEYLNNYNGGFFRYFNGLPQNIQDLPRPTHFNRPHRYPSLYQKIRFTPQTEFNNYQFKKVNGEKRIQTKPSRYPDTSKSAFRFPYFDDEVEHEVIQSAFPNEKNVYQNWRQPKDVAFPERFSYLKSHVVFPQESGITDEHVHLNKVVF